MEAIRIGNDIAITWAIVRNGVPEDFRAKALSLFICHQYGREKVNTFSVDGNVLRFAFLGRNQRYIGDYGLLLIVNDGADGMFSVDLDKAFRLTNHSECNCFGIIKLVSDLTLPSNGLSAYELAVINGYKGTESEWLESLVQPSKDAASEALAAAGRADAATETVTTTNNTIRQAEQLRAATEQERVAAEESRAKAETLRSESESFRESAEQSRTAAEENRTAAESERDKSEMERQSEESVRHQAEAVRQQSETARKKSEDARVISEQARVAAESSREADESKRASAENTRADAESGRVLAEQSREDAEETRVREFSQLELESKAATSNATDAAVKANTAAAAAEKAASIEIVVDAETGIISVIKDE